MKVKRLRLLARYGLILIVRDADDEPLAVSPVPRLEKYQFRAIRRKYDIWREDILRYPNVSLSFCGRFIEKRTPYFLLNNEDQDDNQQRLVKEWTLEMLERYYPEGE